MSEQKFSIASWWGCVVSRSAVLLGACEDQLENRRVFYTDAESGVTFELWALFYGEPAVRLVAVIFRTDDVDECMSVEQVLVYLGLNPGSGGMTDRFDGTQKRVASLVHSESLNESFRDVLEDFRAVVLLNNYVFVDGRASSFGVRALLAHVEQSDIALSAGLCEMVRECLGGSIGTVLCAYGSVLPLSSSHEGFRCVLEANLRALAGESDATVFVRCASSKQMSSRLSARSMSPRAGNYFAHELHVFSPLSADF
ncbi:hypothetical protein [Corynebacterium aquilae]|uniref:Uncharacterized protein n=1 Tax=Corynebacterium aquilae DSM 44791 TaxID=1431546 RepID=A0A1L7CFK9_9CORY|nr:hypothetical protein [Corynebacterium aquilae]APT84627.1 hypothetical protein CAQU_05580 [Corynebacterium aquilae DSM 44791]